MTIEKEGENTLKILSIFFRISRLILIKISANHLWVKEIQDYSNYNPGSVVRQEKYNNAKTW
jgi:hypothetical protein